MSNLILQPSHLYIQGFLQYIYTYGLTNRNADIAVTMLTLTLLQTIPYNRGYQHNYSGPLLYRSRICMRVTDGGNRKWVRATLTPGVRLSRIYRLTVYLYSETSRYIGRTRHSLQLSEKGTWVLRSTCVLSQIIVPRNLLTGVAI